MMRLRYQNAGGGSKGGVRNGGGSKGGGEQVVAWVAAVGVTILAVWAGLSSAGAGLDIDEALYRSVVSDMHAGTGYYDALRQGADQPWLGQLPRQLGHVWAVRPPTAYLVWQLAEPDAWRWLVAMPVGASLAALVVLTGSRPRWGAAIAVALASLWVLRFTPHLYLHTELWAMPLLLWGAVLLRRRPTVAAGLLFAAALTREMLVVGLVVGLVVVLTDRDPEIHPPIDLAHPWAERLRLAAPWLVALAGWGVALAMHTHHAVETLTPGVTDPPFWNAALGADYRLGAFFPGQSWFPSVPFLAFVLGLAGTWGARRTDTSARFVLLFCPALAVATVVVARPYWQPMWALLPLPWVAIGSLRVVAGVRSRTAGSLAVTRP